MLKYLTKLALYLLNVKYLLCAYHTYLLVVTETSIGIVVGEAEFDEVCKY